MANPSLNLVTDPAEWDNLLFKYKQTFQHFAQWEHVKSSTWSFKRYKVGDYPIQIATKKGLKGLFKLGYIAPLTTNGLNEKIYKAIKEFSKNEGFDALIVETRTEDKKYLVIMEQLKFKKYFSEVQPRNTNVLDLAMKEDTQETSENTEHIKVTKGTDIKSTEGTNSIEEELFAGLKGKYRREIRKAAKNGLIVSTYNSGTKAVNQFYEIISSVVGRGKFTTYKKEYFQTMFDSLKNHAEIHIVHEKYTPEKALGAYLVLYDQETAYELYGGTNTDGRKKRVGFLLKWVSIQKALEHYVKNYDQWGVAKRDINGKYIKSDPLYNISVFKKGFGGKDITFIPSMVIVNSPIKYGVYRLGMFVKPVFLKILKKVKK